MTVSLDEYLTVAGQPVVVTERRAGESAAFWKRLLSLASWLRVEHVPTEPGSITRTELVARRAHGAMAFVGEIAGRQLEPLVATLRALATAQPELDTPATPRRLSELRSDVALVVAVSPSCPFCPNVAAVCLRLACVSSHLSVTVLRADTGLAPPMVRSVPSVLADGELIATGSVGEYELVERIAGHASR